MSAPPVPAAASTEQTITFESTSRYAETTAGPGDTSSGA